MKNNQNSWDISYCGLNCAVCDIYIASHGNDNLHKELLTWFRENVDPKIEKISCEGCRGPNSKCWTSDCFFRECAEKKGHQYCFECLEMPCDKLKEFVEDGISHHARTVENMKEMKRLGLKKWINSQDEVKFCP